MRADGNLQSLVDVLIPGDGHFPPASAVGAHGLLAERLREQLGTGALAAVLTTLNAATGGTPMSAMSGGERVAAVERFERGNPELFAAVRNILYFGYYQSPLVVAAIRDLGVAYNDAPQPLGYAMAPFDATPGTDAPSHARGSYVPTEAVTRIATLPSAARATGSEQER